MSFNVLVDCATTPEVELEPPVADEEKPGDGERGVAGGFRFKCTDAKGAEATLVFELREPVVDAKCYAVLNPSRTKTKRVRCDLVKEEPHFFDRLTAGEKELKGVASVDYDRWVEAPDDEAAPAAESVDYGRGVTLLDAALARKEHDVVLDVSTRGARARNSSAQFIAPRNFAQFLTRRPHARRCTKCVPPRSLRRRRRRRRAQARLRGRRARAAVAPKEARRQVLVRGTHLARRASSTTR